MEKRQWMLTNRNFADLNPLVAGTEPCRKDKSFGPWVRDYTLIHYVQKGRGTLFARGGAYPVKEGQAFLILPGEVTTYTADSREPWEYAWIGFNGQLTDAFGSLPPVFDLPEDFFHTVLHGDPQGEMVEYRLAAMLFRLYAWLFSESRTGNQHVRRVENYIRSNYMQAVRVEEIAQRMGLNRRYLSRLFKQQTGRSVQEYLIDVRMEAACRHLTEGCSVKEVARLCGYEDVSNFSKMFKACFGQSPASYR